GAAAAATLDRERQRIGTSRLAIAAALAVLAALLVETQLDPLVVGMFPTSAAAYMLGVPPVLLASWIIVRSLRDAPAASGTIYAFDLAGAATGGLLGYLAIGTLGDQALYGLASALCLVAATLFIRPSASRIGLRRVTTIGAAVGLVAMLGVWGGLLAPPGQRRDDGAPTRRAVGHRGRGQPRGRRADAWALRRIQRRGLCGHACPPGRGRGAQLRAPFRRSLRPGRHDRGR